MGVVTAALITGQGAVEYQQFDEGPPAAGCVTIDIRLCGICGTDIASYRSGHLHSPAVCGHEWAGTVRDLVFDDTVADIYLGPTLTARLRERFSRDRGEVTA